MPRLLAHDGGLAQAQRAVHDLDGEEQRLVGRIGVQPRDEPPGTVVLPDITANTTIAELKEKHIEGEFENVTEDLIIEGVVIADDASGNFYRQIILQDATGGIELRLNKNELYNDFPIGRQLFVKANGLTLGDYNGLVQLGGGTYIDDRGDTRLAGIEELFINDYLVRGLRDQKVEPKIWVEDIARHVKEDYQG